MTQGTDQAGYRPTPPPEPADPIRESRHTKPATVAECREEYGEGAAAREGFDKRAKRYYA